MRIINSFDGSEPGVGDTFADPVMGSGRILAVRDRFFSAQVLIAWPDGTSQWAPLLVRFLHPAFFLQRVAFILT